jgi:hypothetical protein
MVKILATIKSVFKKAWVWLTNRWTIYISLAVWLLFFNTASALFAFTDYFTTPLDVWSFAFVMLIYIGLSAIWGYFMPRHETEMAHFRDIERKDLNHLWGRIEDAQKQLQKDYEANEKLKADILKGEVEVVMIRHNKSGSVTIGGDVYRKVVKSKV